MLHLSNPFSLLKQKSQYHPELLELFNKDVPISATVGNFLVPIILWFTYQEYIPQVEITMWLLLAFAIGTWRIVLGKMKYFSSNYLKQIYISSALSGATWGALSVLTHLYAPPEYLTFLTIVVLGMIGGANTTLTPIYKAYLYYSLFAIMPFLMVHFSYHDSLHEMTMVLIVVFTLFVLSGGHKHYSKLHEAILLKDRLKLLNEDLEGEVHSRTQELEILNNSLEERVSQEIEKNRNKDQQLLQQSRMAQMGEMISMIAHQWRQPLGAISSTVIGIQTKMMLGKFNLQEPQEVEACQEFLMQRLEHIDTYVQSLSTTIDDFRNFYKPNKACVDVNINEPIEKSLSIVQTSMEGKGIMIEKSFKSQRTLSLFDSELMQVFLNILKNSQDNFVEKAHQNPTIMISTQDTDDGVRVEICDNGGGIPSAIQEKIFDPYFSTKDEKNGTGLGLYMSKTIVEEHHKGKLSVENREEGVCFTLFFESTQDQKACSSSEGVLESV